MFIGVNKFIDDMALERAEVQVGDTEIRRYYYFTSTKY